MLTLKWNGGYIGLTVYPISKIKSTAYVSSVPTLLHRPPTHDRQTFAVPLDVFYYIPGPIATVCLMMAVAFLYSKEPGK